MHDPEEIGVLLIGESSRSFSHIVERLEKGGCRCRFADSYEEAHRLLSAEGFELVLSVIPPRENAISSLANQLAGTRASIYYAQAVEDGCWWLPALRRGERCFGAPALRPSEFAGLLTEMVEEIHTGLKSAPEPVVHMLMLPEEGRTPAKAVVKARSKAAG